MIRADLAAGARNAVRVCLNIRAEDRVFIIRDQCVAPGMCLVFTNKPGLGSPRAVAPLPGYALQTAGLADVLDAKTDKLAVRTNDDSEIIAFAGCARARPITAFGLAQGALP